MHCRELPGQVRHEKRGLFRIHYGRIARFPGRTNGCNLWWLRVRSFLLRHRLLHAHLYLVQSYKLESDSTQTTTKPRVGQTVKNACLENCQSHVFRKKCQQELGKCVLLKTLEIKTNMWLFVVNLPRVGQTVKSTCLIGNRNENSQYDTVTIRKPTGPGFTWCPGTLSLIFIHNYRYI